MSVEPNTQAVLQSEATREELVQLVNTELRQRPVSQNDVDAFRHFAIPSLLHSAQGRTLSDAEARTITAMLTQPGYQQSVKIPGMPIPNESQCVCSRHSCPECSAPQFKDYAFGPIHSDYQKTAVRTGKINNIWHSIYAPQPGRSQEWVNQ